MGFESLYIGASSLYATQRAAEVAAHNIANANNDGYTRQRMNISSSQPSVGTPGMRGTGVQLISIDRLRDKLADVSYRAEAQTAGSTQARSDILGRAESILGPYAEGVPDTLDKFWSAWRDLATTPTEPAARLAVMNSGQALVDSLNDASTSLATIREDAFGQAQDDVDQVNNLAKHVARLNQQIADAEVSGANPNDLLDQRDTALDQLVSLTGASIRQGGSLNRADVYVGNNPLVIGVNVNAMTTKLTAAGIVYELPAGSTTTPGGALGGLAQAINADLPAYQTHLDAVAEGVVTWVNSVHAKGYNLVDPATQPDPSDPTKTIPAPPTGGDFFSGTSAGTIKLAITSTSQIAASGAGNANDGNNAIALANVADVKAFTTDAAGMPVVIDPTDTTAHPDATSIAETLRGLVGRLGTTSADAGRAAEAAGSSADAALKLRAASDSVSTDEEMVDLAKYQHSYEAAARVISIADSMLDTLINRTGAGR